MRTVIFDIDGTLADLSHRRHWVATKPKNWKAFHAGLMDDGVHWHVVDVLKRFRPDHKIVLCSGREEVYRVPTNIWLNNKAGLKMGVHFDALYMRPEKDYRTDDVIKSELLDRILSDGYDPVLVFDDRDRVVNMWRERGIPCFQVAPGDF